MTHPDEATYRPGVGVWSGAAPAKVNLELAVLGREESGYHQIRTIFQALTLADHVTVRRIDGEDRTRLEITGVPEGELGPTEENLAFRAAEVFRGALRAKGLGIPGIGILLEKHVPHGAGLGGGSSDAAAVLRGLNDLTGRALEGSDLMELGARLGSDVPFFVSGASRARGSGRGERILPLEPLPQREILLAAPKEPVSTAWAYGALARYREGQRFHTRRSNLASGSGGWAATESRAENDFEEALFPLRPELARIKMALIEAGARPALLSGSGSAVFGVFETEELVSEAEQHLRGVDGVAWTIRTRTAL